MKQLCLYIFLSVLTPSVVSQTPLSTTKADIATQSNLLNLGSGKPIIQTFDDRYDGVKGNRYFYDDQYHNGLLMRLDSTIISNNAMFRFDQLSGVVQVKYPDRREQVLDIYQIMMLQLKIDGQDVVFVKDLIPGTAQEYRLLQVIYYSPTLKLFRDVRKKLVRVNETGAYSKGVIYDEISNDFRHYIKRNERAFIEVKPSRKSFIKAMPDVEEKIEKIFNMPQFKNDLPVSKLAALMKLLDDAMHSKPEKK